MRIIHVHNAFNEEDRSKSKKRTPAMRTKAQQIQDSSDRTKKKGNTVMILLE